MRPPEAKVTFQPSGRSVFVLPGTKLIEAAGRAGAVLQTPCGGQGTCGKCRVKVVSGANEPDAATRAVLRKAQVAAGFRLACQSAVAGPLVVEVPEESMFGGGRSRILVKDSGAHAEVKPVLRKVFFELPPPTSEDAASDLSRLGSRIGADVSVPHEILRRLPAFLRGHGWRGTAVLADHRLIALEPGDTSRSLYGVGFDIGTTTVVGKLFDLNTGREAGVESRLNPQIPYGDDVISRIMRIRRDPLALGELQQAILGAVNEIVGDLCAQAAIEATAIYEVVIAGNSTMQELLCGYDPSALGELPFIPVFERAQRVGAAALGVRANSAADVYVFPQIGGFVGGDTVAGMIAARIDRWKRPVLLVDIGTNGEIVLANGSALMATSTAAGPAFEGARIRQGMRATAGAIEKVIIRDDVTINVIGDVNPVGICGTALIDAAADLLRTGIIDPTGRILPAAEAPAALPAALRRRIVEEDGDVRFVLVSVEESGNGQEICLWQRDVRELQLAVAAIRAGINVLLRRAGVAAGDLEAVLLAGAFGNFIRRNNARRIGLLPQIPCSRIRFIGNAASLGAKLALLSSAERDYAEGLSERAEHVDLSLDPEFQNEFGAAMMFPEGDPDGCTDAETH